MQQERYRIYFYKIRKFRNQKYGLTVRASGNQLIWFFIHPICYQHRKGQQCTTCSSFPPLRRSFSQAGVSRWARVSPGTRMEEVGITVERPSTRHRLCESTDPSIILLLQRESSWCETGPTVPSRIAGHMVRAMVVADAPHFTIRT